MSECRVCHGLGYVEPEFQDWDADDKERDLYEECPSCLGSGQSKKQRRPKKQRWDDGEM